MKVLLINPSLNVQKIFGNFGKFMEPMPCIGLAYIAAVLEKNGTEVHVIDDFATHVGLGGIIKKVREIKPDMVGMTCLTPAAPGVYRLVGEIKKADENIRIVLGNLHASIFSEDILKNGAADIIVHGEGEETIVDLVNTIESGGELKNVRGISFLEDDRVVFTGKRDLIEDLDKLPFPAWHLFPHKKYGLFPIATIKKPILTILGSRGCPFRCKFCALEYMGKKYRKRSPENIVDEMEYLVKRYSVRQIGFVDQLFPFVKDHAIGVCNEIIRRGLQKKVIWVSETRVDTVDKETLKSMKQAGCRRVMYGIESGVQYLLDSINKGFKLEDAERAVRESKEVGLETVGFFMIGLPNETREMTRQTIEFAKKLDLDFAKFAITIPLPGSELYESKVKKDGNYTRSWDKFSTLEPKSDDVVYVPEGMTREELIKMMQKAIFEFYVRPRIIFNLLFRIRTIEPKYLVTAGRIYFMNKLGVPGF